MLTSSPTIVGLPASVWMTALSCRLLRAPSTISSMSPRMTAPNHTFASAPIRTFPMTVALGATHASSSMSGV